MIDKWEVIALDNTVQNLEEENTAAHARYDEVMVENRRLNGELEQQAAEVRRLQGYLEKIAFVNCTCDDWENSTNTDPAPHDVYCIYRVLTGIGNPASVEVTDG